MPHFRVDDALHSHPKARQAGLEAMGLWNMCGSYCMGYLTDGFVPEWYVKTWPKGAALAKRLVAAKMWTPAERDGENGWQFHEFTGPGRNDTRAQIEESRKRWRDKKAGQRGDSPGDSQGESPGDTRGESLGDSLRVTRDPTQPNPTEEISGHLPEAARPSNASDGIAATIGAKLLNEAGIDPALPDSPRLRSIANELVKAGSAPADVTQGLRDWNARTGLGPGVLRSLVSDVVKLRNGHATNGNGKPSKLRTAATLAAELRAEENAQLATATQKELR